MGPDTCELLWVKPEGRAWQRFFLDVGLTVWEEWSEERAFEDFDLEDELVEIGETLALSGKVIGTVEATSDRSGWGLNLRFMDGSAIQMWPEDSRDFDSDTHFEFVASTTS